MTPRARLAVIVGGILLGCIPAIASVNALSLKMRSVPARTS